MSGTDLSIRSLSSSSSLFEQVSVAIIRILFSKREGFTEHSVILRPQDL
jgi:hypothetical protein